MTIIFTAEDWQEIAFPVPAPVVKVATTENPLPMFFAGEWIMDNGEW